MGSCCLLINIFFPFMKYVILNQLIILGSGLVTAYKLSFQGAEEILVYASSITF